MMFKSVKSATAFIKRLRVTKGYSKDSTSEWRRLSMKLSDAALIQFARRLAVRLEAEKGFLIGIDEQEFDPRVYVLDRDKYCLLPLTKRVDEQTKRVTYALGHVSEEISGHLIDVSEPPTDGDLTHALMLIDSMSWGITGTKRADKGQRGQDRRQ